VRTLHPTHQRNIKHIASALDDDDDEALLKIFIVARSV
jgi:hypothetical protein